MICLFLQSNKNWLQTKLAKTTQSMSIENDRTCHRCLKSMHWLFFCHGRSLRPRQYAWIFFEKVSRQCEKEWTSPGPRPKGTVILEIFVLKRLMSAVQTSGQPTGLESMTLEKDRCFPRSQSVSCPMNYNNRIGQLPETYGFWFSYKPRRWAFQMEHIYSTTCTVMLWSSNFLNKYLRREIGNNEYLITITTTTAPCSCLLLLLEQQSGACWGSLWTNAENARSSFAV